MQRKIGLLLGDEEDWPSVLEELARRLGPNLTYRGETFQIDVERIRIHPFQLNAPTRYNLVIDRSLAAAFPKSGLCGVANRCLNE